MSESGWSAEISLSCDYSAPVIDLHAHSNRSDGKDSPTELVENAKAAGVSVLAITDHDSTSGWSEAITALRPSLSLVLGAEISTLTLDGISVHMLGLLFDGEDKNMQNMLAESRDTRIPRMRKMIDLLAADGINISIEDVMAATPVGATLGRPHLADALVARGHVASREEAFAALLHNKSKYYINHYSPSPVDAIKLIKAAGGVAVIAHPLASQRGRTISMDLFDQLIAAGLDGVEVDHRDHSEIEKSELLRLAIERDLIITGSSDYHGTGKLNQLAEYTTHPRQWEALEVRAKSRRVVQR